MEDQIYIACAAFAVYAMFAVGALGSFLPVLPGPLLAGVALFGFKVFVPSVPISWLLVWVGVAVALMLMVLDDGDIAHPPVECVFTTEEEVGLNGARTLDKSQISARTMINMDSEEEGATSSSLAFFSFFGLSGVSFLAGSGSGRKIGVKTTLRNSTG